MIIVEFAVESGESCEREMPAVPRKGETLVWMSTDLYPGDTAPVQTETAFLVADVEWFIWEGDGETTPGATVRVQLVRAHPRPKPGETPPWMQLDSYDLGEEWQKARGELRRAESVLAAAQIAEQEAARVLLAARDEDLARHQAQG